MLTVVFMVTSTVTVHNVEVKCHVTRYKLLALCHISRYVTGYVTRHVTFSKGLAKRDMGSRLRVTLLIHC